MKDKTPNEEWTLSMGCHRGTLVSRDPCQPQTLGSLDACRQALADAEKNWKRVGCSIWYATAIGPDGERVTLHEGVPYR